MHPNWRFCCCTGFFPPHILGWFSYAIKTWQYGPQQSHSSQWRVRLVWPVEGHHEHLPCAVSRAQLTCHEGAWNMHIYTKSAEVPVLVKLNPLMEKKIRIRCKTLISITIWSLLIFVGKAGSILYTSGMAKTKLKYIITSLSFLPTLFFVLLSPPNVLSFSLGVWSANPQCPPVLQAFV